MSRDYKNISKSARPPGLLLGHLLSVLTGLAVGLLIAFLVYIYNVQPARQTDKQPAIASTPTLEPKQPAAKEEPQVPEPMIKRFYQSWVDVPLESGDRQEDEPDYLVIPEVVLHNPGYMSQGISR